MDPINHCLTLLFVQLINLQIVPDQIRDRRPIQRLSGKRDRPVSWSRWNDDVHRLNSAVLPTRHSDTVDNFEVTVVVGSIGQQHHVMLIRPHFRHAMHRAEHCQTARSTPHLVVDIHAGRIFAARDINIRGQFSVFAFGD